MGSIGLDWICRKSLFARDTVRDQKRIVLPQLRHVTSASLPARDSKRRRRRSNSLPKGASQSSRLFAGNGGTIMRGRCHGDAAVVTVMEEAKRIGGC